MDSERLEEVDQQLSDWILRYLNGLVRRGFTAREVLLALEWAHESFAVQHLFDRPPEEEPVEPEPEELEEPEPEPEPVVFEPKGIPVKASPEVIEALAPPPVPAPPAPELPPKPKPKPKPKRKGDLSKGECEKCGRQMKIENRSRARYTEFILWSCTCGFKHLERRIGP